MPKITYTDASGAERTVEGKNGMTVMETAIKHNVPKSPGRTSAEKWAAAKDAS